MSTKKSNKVKVKDLKPKKDAVGGRGGAHRAASHASARLSQSTANSAGLRGGSVNQSI